MIFPMKCPAQWRPSKVSFNGNNAFPMKIPVPQKARYVRFISTKRRQVEQQGNRIVPTRVKEIRIYAETTDEVSQSMIRTYALDASKAELIFRTDVHNYGSAAANVAIPASSPPAISVFQRRLAFREIPARKW